MQAEEQEVAGSLEDLLRSGSGEDVEDRLDAIAGAVASTNSGT